MINYQIIGLVAFCASLLLMPLLLKISEGIGAVSEVGGRHVGVKPIGRLGGVGVVIGIIVAVTVAIFSDRASVSFSLQDRHKTLGLLCGGILIGGVGFIDDIRRLSARFKFAVQLIGACLAYQYGLRIVALDLPIINSFALGWMSAPLTVVWIVGVVNAINLIDGLDGLAGGVVVFAAIVNLVAALYSGHEMPAIIMVSTIGSVIAFLLFNWHPAKIYLGDGGAYSLGYILAVNSLLAPHQKATTSVAILVPLLATGLPIFDTLLTMLRRALEARKIFSPDRGHLHHILLDAGISHKRVVIGLYLVSLFLASMALIIVLGRHWQIGLFLGLASMIGGGIWGIGVKHALIAGLQRRGLIKYPYEDRSKRDTSNRI
jgi:UDP-GlcNAc:undecaprenyl-phosphate GlcNAc-1-phosphate transferase